MTAFSAPDFQRPIRRPSERLALVEYVAATPNLQENEHLEWKSGYDLSTKLGAAKLAKQLIGFANRDPIRAAKLTGGYAYVMLGVEAGQISGIQVWDSADIENWLAPFVGSDLIYDVHYVSAQSNDVLVFEVDPPAQGGEIYALQTTTGDNKVTLKAGTIYVRRGGKTEIAGPADIKMLTARAQQDDETHLNIEVDAAFVHLPVLEAALLDEKYRDRYLADRRDALLANMPQGHQMFPPAGEFRQPHTLRKEIDKYLAGLRNHWAVFQLTQHAEANDPRFQLKLNNPTDENFENVVVEATVEVPTALFASNADALVRKMGLPREPPPWGSGSDLRFDPPSLPSTTDFESLGTTTTKIRFAPRHVYPQSSNPLEPVSLVLPPKCGGSNLHMAWRATASNTRGQVAGEIQLELPNPEPTVDQS